MSRSDVASKANIFKNLCQKIIKDKILNHITKQTKNNLCKLDWELGMKSVEIITQEMIEDFLKNFIVLKLENKILNYSYMP